jgi:hypothetical protein
MNHNLQASGSSIRFGKDLQSRVLAEQSPASVPDTQMALDPYREFSVIWVRLKKKYFEKKGSKDQVQ